MSRIITFIVAIYLIAGCNSNEENSPYSEVLSQPAFVPLSDSIKKEPKNDELYFRRAVLLNKNNFPEPALEDFKKAWSLSKQEKYAIGVSTLLLEKNTTEAINFLREALNELPESILLQLSLARAYDAAGKTDDALAALRAALLKDSSQPNALLLQADLLQKKGDSASSATALEKAHALAPLNLDISYKLAYQYAENKNPKVIALTDSLIAKDSLHLHPDPFYVRGLYYSNIHDRAKAIQWFDETTKRDYNYLNAYIEKGKILLEQKKINDALKTFSLANKITPAFADAWYWIGRCQEAMGNKQEAKTNYEKAYELDNTFTEAKEAAGKIK